MTDELSNETPHASNSLCPHYQAKFCSQVPYMVNNIGFLKVFLLPEVIFVQATF